MFIDATRFITSSGGIAAAGIGWPAIDLAGDGVASTMVSADQLPEGCPTVRALWTAGDARDVTIQFAWYYAAPGANLNQDGIEAESVDAVIRAAGQLVETKLGMIPGRGSEMAYVALGVKQIFGAQIHLLGLRIG